MALTKKSENINFDKLSEVYNNLFSFNYISDNLSDKLACIALTCYITNEVRKKGKKVTCYDILLKVGSDFPDYLKNTFLKALGIISEDFMYECKDFPDFGIPPKEMPKQLKVLLEKYIPF